MDFLGGDLYAEDTSVRRTSMRSGQCRQPSLMASRPLARWVDLGRSTSELDKCLLRAAAR